MCGTIRAYEKRNSKKVRSEEMILALKIILILIMCISFMGAVAEKDNHFRMTVSAVCIASMFALVAMFIWV